ncbi:MAG TPA: DUF3298 and DUF4163 domain-containing protein [Flavilitoribacter sp.]|nr:DUF3298 and DUF4163 domain-containing protein [Flavilitoribacter sp.]HMQ86525.1 DUF3298 and DUF4163 domain-containing protein [Flavilitoribacter sp.]
MNRISNCFLFAALAGALTACGPSADKQGADPAIRFDKSSAEWHSPGCAADSSKCLNMSVSYPVAQGEPAEVVQLINDTIQFRVRNSMDVFAVEPGTTPPSMDTIAVGLIKEYEDQLRESPDYSLPWEVAVSGEVLSNTEKWASVSIGTYSYMGGAHPNSFVSLLNFDLSSGKTLSLEDITADMNKLKALVQVKFREVRNLMDGQNFDETDFFWGQGFTLPENFALGNEGLYFFYNPYEVASYASGPTEFTIPYDHLGGILKPEWIKTQK